MAMGSASTAIGPHHLVQRADEAKWWAFQKSTIVALARKLLIAIWKYVNAGVVIEGAALKAA